MVNLKGYTILVVEDDVFSMEMLSHMLVETKASVLLADDGEKALKIFSMNKVDLVLLDIRLPKLSGFEVLKEMKRMDPQIPVIAQSAFSYNNEKEKGISIGFDDFLIKPIVVNVLDKTLKKYLLK